MQTTIFNEINQYCKDQLRSISETAYLLRCDSRTVKRLIKSGDVVAIRRGKSGATLIIADSVAAMLIEPLVTAASENDHLPGIMIDELEIMRENYCPNLESLSLLSFFV
jgi:hypothetical protein